MGFNDFKNRRYNYIKYIVPCQIFFITTRKQENTILYFSWKIKKDGCVPSFFIKIFSLFCIQLKLNCVIRITTVLRAASALFFAVFGVVFEIGFGPARAARNYERRGYLVQFVGDILKFVDDLALAAV